MEAIRREAEQKIAAIQLSLETQERVEKERIADVKRQSKHLLDDAQQVAQSLEDGMRLRNGATGVSPSDLMALLLKTRRSGVVESVKERAVEVRRRSADDPALYDLTPQEQHEATMQQQHHHHQPSMMMSSSSRAPPTPTPYWGGSNNGQTPNHYLPQQQQQQQQPSRHHDMVSTPVASNSSLYAKFLRAKEQQQQQQQQSMTPSGRVLADPDAPFRSTVRDSTKAALDAEAKKTKEMVTAGWALFRRGDRQGAYRTWLDVYERNRNNPTGARAKAYIAEALERNYSEAADWYEKALAMDRQDCLTLYNYGVLLES